MKLLERCAALAETAALVGPVQLAGLAVSAAFSALLFTARMVGQGYHRCLFSSR